MTTFDAAIDRARHRFPSHGRFKLLPGESIDVAVSRERVPNARGIYVVFKRNDFHRPLYIGKAGTFVQGNAWKDQCLPGRLTAKQDDMSRREYFRQLMERERYDGLTFLWFVTHDEKSNMTLPALAEMELIQAHYDQFGDLPLLNKSV